MSFRKYVNLWSFCREVLSKVLRKNRGILALCFANLCEFSSPCFAEFRVFCGEVLRFFVANFWQNFGDSAAEFLQLIGAIGAKHGAAAAGSRHRHRRFDTSSKST